MSKTKSLLRYFEQKTTTKNTELQTGDIVINREKYTVLKNTEKITLSRK